MVGVIGIEYLKKDRQQLLYDLICQDNPKFAQTFGVNDFTVSNVKAITADAYGRNTSCRITPKVNDGTVVGYVDVNYRRLDLSVLFRSIRLEFTEYRAAGSATKADFIEVFERIFGVRFHTEDLTNSSIIVSATAGGNANSLGFAASSWCWASPGTTVSVFWNRGKIPLANYVGDRSLAGRNWPQSMIAIGDGAKPQGELLTYDIDCTSIRTTLSNLATGVFDNGTWNSSLDLSAVVAFLKAQRPDINWSRSDYRAAVGGLGYMYSSRYSLPHASLPEANSAKYKFCFVLVPAVANHASSWIYGKILLHYN